MRALNIKLAHRVKNAEPNFEDVSKEQHVAVKNKSPPKVKKTLAVERNESSGTKLNITTTIIKDTDGERTPINLSSKRSSKSKSKSKSPATAKSQKKGKSGK